MSALAVVWNLDQAPTSVEILEAMADVSAYRGPDGVSLWIDQSVGMANLRLNSTPHADRSPMPFIWRHLSLVADARIDNRPELIAELNVRDASNPGDAELILLAYRRWGRACPAHLIGDFAFVLWDSEEQVLFAARDVMGARTLYYSRKGNTLCFATEARQLTAHPHISNTISRQAILMCLLNCYDDRISMFEDVKGIGRGHHLTATREGIRIEPYWQVERISPLHYKNQQDYFEHFRSLFKRCVADRCRGSLVGTHLSGGMDSSSVTAMAHAATRDSSIKIQPFSYRFRRLSDCDESPFSQAVAARLELKIDWIDAELHWVFKGIFEDPTKREFPFYGWDRIAHQTFERLAEQGGRTLLTGHGGDSLMGGPAALSISSAARWRGLYRHLIAPRLPEKTNRLVKRLFKRTPSKPSWIPAQTYQACQEGAVFLDDSPRKFDKLARQLMFVHIHHDSDGIRRAIHSYDRMAAPFGIEVRHPFFDRRLAEFMLSIPPELVSHGDRPKGFLRRAMSDLLPESVLRRQDKPTLRSFYHYGIRNEARNIKGVFQNSRLADLGLVDSHCLAEAVQSYLGEDPGRALANFVPAVWAELWLRNEER